MADERSGWSRLLELDASTYLLGGALLFYGRGSIVLLPFVFGVLVRVVDSGRSDDEAGHNGQYERDQRASVRQSPEAGQ